MYIKSVIATTNYFTRHHVLFCITEFRHSENRVVLGAGAMQLALRTPLPLRVKRYTLPSNRSIRHLTQLCMRGDQCLSFQ